MARLSVSTCTVVLVVVLVHAAVWGVCRGQLYPQGIGTGHVYPYGPGAGDTALSRNDDGGSSELTLSAPFMFFGQSYPSLWVNTNGLLSAHGRVSQYTPDSFPLNNGLRRVIAPYWADVDTSDGNGHGNDDAVYYREDTSSSTRDRASDDVYAAFGSDFRDFTASGVFIATWHRVTFFGADISSTTPINTFQAVLIWNSEHSFVLFNYDGITWTTGTASGGDSITGLGGTPAQVGFDAGDGVNYYNVEGSRTHQIASITGRYRFRIDAQGISSNVCEDTIHVSPRTVLLLGGGAVAITGPCLDDVTVAMATFYDTSSRVDHQVTCVVDVAAEQVVCVPERFMSTGLRQFDLLLTDSGGRDFMYTSSIHVLYKARNADGTLRLDSDTGPFADDIDVSFVWDVTYFWSTQPDDADPAATADLVFTRITESSSGGALQYEEVPLMQDVPLSRGRVTVDPDVFHELVRSDQLTLEFYGAPTLVQRGNNGRRLHGDIGPALWFRSMQLYAILKTQIDTTAASLPSNVLNVVETMRVHAEYLRVQLEVESIDLVYITYPELQVPDSVHYGTQWYKDASSIILDAVYKQECADWLVSQPEVSGTDHVIPVPCFRRQAERDGRFVQDDLCSGGSDGCRFYFSGVTAHAYDCYRLATPFIGSGQFKDEVVCYDEAGNLIPSFQEGGGRLRTVHPLSGNRYVSHFYADVLPYLQCCHFLSDDTLCVDWSLLRPADDCTGYQPPTPAMGNGDPHMTTLDGVQYTFNGVGQFLIVQSDVDDFVMQGRAEQFRADDGSLVDASAWTSFVMSQDDAAVVQVDAGVFGGVTVIVNGEEVSFANLLDPTLEFDNAQVEHIDGSSAVTVAFTGGARIEITETAAILNFVLYLPHGYMGGTSGLLGLWNGDPADDLMPRGSRTPVSDLTDHQQVFDYGWTWTLTSSTALFTYTSSRDFDYYDRPDFQPVFEPVVSAEQEAEVTSLCGSSAQCRFDFLTTGNRDVAMATQNAIDTFVEVLNTIQTVARCSFIEAPRNGYVIATLYTVGSSVEFRCNYGYALSGPTSTRCLDTLIWSSPTPICQEVFCSTPSSVTNGRVDGLVSDTSHQYTVGSTLRYQCDECHQLDGPLIRTCLGTGLWSGTNPTCQHRPIQASPSRGPSLGGVQVRFSGGCYNTTGGPARARFASASVTCTILSVHEVECIAPIVPQTGDILVKLYSNDEDRTLATAHYHLYEELESENSLLLNNPLSDGTARPTVVWNTTIVNTTTVHVDFITFRYQSDGSITAVSVPLARYTHNTGRYRLPQRLPLVTRAVDLVMATFGTVRVAQNTSTTFSVSMWSPINIASYYTNMYLQQLAYLKYPELVEEYAEEQEKSERQQRSISEHHISSSSISSSSSFSSSISRFRRSSSGRHMDDLDGDGVWYNIKHLFDVNTTYTTTLQDKYHEARSLLYYDLCTLRSETASDSPPVSDGDGGATDDTANTNTTTASRPSGVPPSPCTVDQAERDVMYIDDDYCTSGSVWCEVLHGPDVYTCKRTKYPTSGDLGQRACYTNSGSLLPSDKGGSSYMTSHPSVTWGQIGHLHNDISRQLECCRYNTKMCDVTASDDCVDYTPAAPALSVGDPHFVTLSGSEFTFNGEGDYVLLSNSEEDIQLQGRAQQATHATTEKAVQATHWAAFAALSGDSDVVEVGLDPVHHTTFYARVEGTHLDLHDIPEDRTWKFEGVDIKLSTNNKTIEVEFYSGFYLKTTIVEKTLTLTTLMPHHYTDGVEGLLTLNNTYSSSSFSDNSDSNDTSDYSRARELYEEASKWSLESAGYPSLFTSPFGTTRDFVPVFDPSTAVDQSGYEAAVTYCDGNTQCIYDYALTGNARLAYATKTSIEQHQLLIQQQKKIMSCGFISQDSGIVSYEATGFTEGHKLTFTCELKDGDKVNTTVVCGSDGTWSPEPPRCGDDEDGDDSWVSILIWCAVGVGALIVVIVLIVVLVLVVKCANSTHHKPARTGRVTPAPKGSTATLQANIETASSASGDQKPHTVDLHQPQYVVPENPPIDAPLPNERQLYG